MPAKSPSVSLKPKKAVPGAEPQTAAAAPAAPAKKSFKLATGAKPAAPAAPAAAPAPVTATAESTKAVTGQAVMAAIDKSDLIVGVATEIEAITEDKVFEAVPSLLENIDHDYIRLGGMLSVIQAKGWFMLKGYKSIKEYIEAECRIKYRKGNYLINIYNGLVASGVRWADVGHLGWTKLKELANILTPANLTEWVPRAEQMSVLQLQEYIANMKKATTPQAPSGNPAATPGVTTMTFKLHADQKETVKQALAKIKELMKTEFDAVALEHMAMDYLAGEGGLKTLPTLKDLMAAKSPEEVIEVFGTVFPDVEISATVPD